MAGASKSIDLEKTLRMMDVADEMRRRRQQVAEHLETSDRQKIRDQLLRRYREMGHAADPELLDEAIDTVLAQQFRFRPPAPGPGLRLAQLYVRRGAIARKWGIPALLVLALLVAGWVAVRGVGAFRAAGQARSVERIERQADRASILLTQVRELAQDPTAVQQAEAHLAQAQRGRELGDGKQVSAALEGLNSLVETLEQEYTLVILRGRERDNVRHYLIVQAVGPEGRPLRQKILNEESGETELVDEWGERVQRAVYEQVARDFSDNRVIDDNVFGEKKRGRLEPETRFESLGRITRW